MNKYRLLLKNYLHQQHIEAGCDEAGRGCLAGPVFAAAVILPPDFYHPLLNDSKKVTEVNRNELRIYIEEQALAYAVARVDEEEIDRINILQASIKAMHLVFTLYFRAFFFTNVMAASASSAAAGYECFGARR